MKFGTFLIKNDYIIKESLDDALSVQKIHKRMKLGRLLVELDYLTTEELNLALTRYLMPQYQKSSIELKNTIERNETSSKIKKIAKEYRAIPIIENDQNIEFVRVDLIEDRLLLEIEKLTTKKVYCWTVSKDTYDFIRQSSEFEGLSKPKIIVSSSQTDDDKLNGSSPYAKFFKEALGSAKNSSVSDIHIEPTQTGINVRFRRHGVLREYKNFPSDHRDGLISTIKSIVNMDLAIVGRPQDARASFQIFKVDIRANSLPTLYGEKIVLRLLDQERSFNLSDSGLDKQALDSLINSVSKKDGLILISGPTGSGKTTTLYSLLCEVDSERNNISTLENPVEYVLPNINQINVQEDGLLTFGASLKALMRQDPDVILVGEVRDQETAELCFKAASTGHLVLSTVHANGAREVIDRLTNLGIDKFSIKSNLRLSAAQRLIPLICQKCAEKPSSDTLKYFENNKELLRIKSSQGCEGCTQGIIGRVPILEVMEKDEIILCTSNIGSKDFKPKVSLENHAYQLAIEGKIDCREVLSLSA